MVNLMKYLKDEDNMMGGSEFCFDGLRCGLVFMDGGCLNTDGSVLKKIIASSLITVVPSKGMANDYYKLSWSSCRGVLSLSPRHAIQRGSSLASLSQGGVSHLYSQGCVSQTPRHQHP